MSLLTVVEARDQLNLLFETIINVTPPVVLLYKTLLADTTSKGSHVVMHIQMVNQICLLEECLAAGTKFTN